MKTLRKLSNRKLDELQDRLANKYWDTVDVSPKRYDPKKAERLRRLEIKIGNERLRRIGL